MPAYTFPRAEKLKSKKQISYLFEHGHILKAYPLILRFAQVPRDEVSTKAAFTVSKRKVRSAVVRNLIKRRIRESYRLHKHEIPDHSGWTWNLMFVFTSNEPIPYAKIDKAMNKIIQKLQSIDTR